MTRTQSATRRAGVAVVAAILGASSAFLAAPGWAAPAPTDSPATRAAALIRPAIVYLESSIPGVATARCTGFVVNPDGYIATAGHCVDPGHLQGEHATSGSGNLILDRIASSGLEVSVLGAGQSGDKVKPVPARVVDVRPLGQGDVALLNVQLSNLPSSQLSTTEPQVGNPVQAIGYPATTATVTDYSLEPTAKSGTISAIRTAGTAPVLEVSAAMSPGMSGGPTIGDDGKVVGINSFRPPDETGDFNYVTAVSELQEMMKNNGVTSELSPADKSYRQALGQYYQGDYSAAIENFDNSLSLSPSYPNAFALRTDAVRRREAAGGGPSSDGNVTTMILIGAGILVAIAAAGGLAYYLYTHRGNRSNSDVPGDALPAGAYAARPPQPSPDARATAPMGQAPPAMGPGGGPSPRCDNCGFELAPGQSFCGRCGKRQE